MPSELPLKQELPEHLAGILYEYQQKKLGNKYLFPRNLKDNKSTHMENADFAQLLMSAGEKFTPVIAGTDKKKRMCQYPTHYVYHLVSRPYSKYQGLACCAKADERDAPEQPTSPLGLH